MGSNIVNLDCPKCNEKASMLAYKRYKYSKPIFAVGALVGTLSIIGVLIAIAGVFSGSLIQGLIIVPSIGGIFIWKELKRKILLYKCSKCEHRMEVEKYSTTINLNCKACDGVKTMIGTEINRFSSVVVIIGWIIAIPSILGILFSLLSVVVYLSSSSDTLALGLGVGLSIILGILSLISGLLGYILIMKKKVYKCNVCGFIIDRA